MAERRDSEQQLTEILKAASDPTRRTLLTILAQNGPTRVTDLAGQFEMSLSAVSKHIKVLEAAGLVSRVTTWREHLITVEIGPTRAINRWFRKLRQVCDQRLQDPDRKVGEASSGKHGP